MEDSLYREIILEHWENPQNYGVISDADIDVSDMNPLCGDEIRITAKIKEGRIVAIQFVAIGCAISKASASLFTEEIKGMELHTVQKITEQEVLDTLGITLTPARMKCALLGWQVIKKGIYDKV